MNLLIMLIWICRSEEAEAANYQYGQQVKQEEEEGPPIEKQKPNFGLSGKLTEEKNIFNGVSTCSMHIFRLLFNWLYQDLNLIIQK